LLHPAAGQDFVVRKLAKVSSLISSGRESTGARIWFIAAGLLYAMLVGITGLAAPKALNFDWFYLLGFGFLGWAVGARAAVILVLASAGFLFYHDVFVGAPAVQPAWIVCWNSVVRLLAYGAVAWVSSEVGRLTRNLEQSVREQTSRLQTETARLQTEVSQHKQTAELLNEAVELFRQVTENISDVFWVTDATKSCFEYISPGFERVWGKSCRELYDSPIPWYEGIHPDDRQRVMRATFARQACGDYDEEYRIVRPDKALRWVHDRAFPVKDSNGVVYRIVGLAQDITEQKRAEQLLQAERDLGTALSSTSRLNVAAEQVLDTAMNLEAIDCGGLYLMNPQTGELHLAAHRGLTADFVERVAHYKATATETRLARAGEITYVRHEQIPRSLETL
jgi:PAS domain S-box-containing protein